MGRLLRYLFTVLAILSLLLFIATITLWIRSYQFSEVVKWRNAGGARTIYSSQGNLVLDLFFMDLSKYPDEFESVRYYRDVVLTFYNYIPALNFDRGDVDREGHWGGFSWWERRTITKRIILIAVIPFWSIAAAAAVLPLAWVMNLIRPKLRRRKLRRAGRCQKCGYDLRATPAEHACPECGEHQGRDARDTGF